MKLLIIVSLILCVPLMSLAQTTRKAFAYDYTVDDLPNGLRLITIPTDYPNLVALQIVVQTGSRNEIEKGKSGYAHLFEHLMFRGSEHYTGQQRDEILKKAGADFTFHRYPTLGHMGIIDEVIEKSRAFIKEKSPTP